MHCYRSILVEEVLDCYLLPEDFDLKKRTKALLELRAKVDTHGSSAILKILQEKQRYS